MLFCCSKNKQGILISWYVPSRWYPMQNGTFTLSSDSIKGALARLQIHLLTLSSAITNSISNACPFYNFDIMSYFWLETWVVKCHGRYSSVLFRTHIMFILTDLNDSAGDENIIYIFVSVDNVTCNISTIW